MFRESESCRSYEIWASYDCRTLIGQNALLSKMRVGTQVFVTQIESMESNVVSDWWLPEFQRFVANRPLRKFQSSNFNAWNNVKRQNARPESRMSRKTRVFHTVFCESDYETNLQVLPMKTPHQRTEHLTYRKRTFYQSVATSSWWTQTLQNLLHPKVQNSLTPLDWFWKM